MAVLEVQHLKKVYTTRFGGNRVQALSDVNFSVGENTWRLWVSPAPGKQHS